MSELLPCPFCGGRPRVDLAKKTFCQLHGEPSQQVTVYCYHADCVSKPSVSAGDVFNGGEAQAREKAIAAWNRRAPSPSPAPGVVEALRIAEERLSSLLARVHRDGGHYEAAHGTEKAWADADEIVARIYADDTQPAHSPAALTSLSQPAKGERP